MTANAKTTETEAPKAEMASIDHTNILKPTHALSITHTKHHTILVHDLSASLTDLFLPKEDLSVDKASKLILATPAPKTVYKIKKENLLGNHLTARDEAEKEVAEWKTPVLNLYAARVVIKFLDEAEPRNVELDPIEGNDGYSESFKLHDQTYIWRSETKHHSRKHLYKITEGVPALASTSAPAAPAKKAIEVARFENRGKHGTQGLLVLDSGEVGELVGVLTLCAMLEHIDKVERNEDVFKNVVSISG